jgi:hypothetical protein
VQIIYGVAAAFYNQVHKKFSLKYTTTDHFVQIAKMVPVRLNRKNPFYNEDDPDLPLIFDNDISKFPSINTRRWNSMTIEEFQTNRLTYVPVLQEENRHHLYDFTMSSYKYVF